MCVSGGFIGTSVVAPVLAVGLFLLGNYTRYSFFLISVHQKSITYNKPTRCNSGSIVFIKNYKYALNVSDALCVHHQEHYKM